MTYCSWGVCVLWYWSWGSWCPGSSGTKDHCWCLAVLLHWLLWWGHLVVVVWLWGSILWECGYLWGWVYCFWVFCMFCHNGHCFCNGCKILCLCSHVSYDLGLHIWSMLVHFCCLMSSVNHWIVCCDQSDWLYRVGGYAVVELYLHGLLWPATLVMPVVNCTHGVVPAPLIIESFIGSSYQLVWPVSLVRG